MSERQSDPSEPDGRPPHDRTLGDETLGDGDFEATIGQEGDLTLDGELGVPETVEAAESAPPVPVTDPTLDVDPGFADGTLTQGDLEPVSTVSDPVAAQAAAVGASILVPGAVLGNYELLRGVGRGAQGQVWLARNLVANREVALKFLSRRFSKDPRALESMRGEASVLFDLTHEAIVRLLNIEQTAGLTFLVMEFLGGQSLASVVNQRRSAGDPKLNADECLWLLEHLAPPLDYANTRKVTHRDIKPGNIMLTENVDVQLPLDQSGVDVKLCDFGIAFVSPDSGSDGKRVAPTGTPPYMAPEVLRGELPTPAADIYSLGATLYALNSGDAPFRAGTLEDLARKVRDTEAQPLRSGNRAFDAAIAAALAKSPADRPKSADELLYLASNKKRGKLAAQRARGYWKVAAASAIVSLGAIGYAVYRSQLQADSAILATPLDGDVTRSSQLPIKFDLDNGDVDTVRVGFRGEPENAWLEIGRERETKSFKTQLAFPADGEFVLELREVGGDRVFGTARVTCDRRVHLADDPITITAPRPYYRTGEAIEVRFSVDTGEEIIGEVTRIMGTDTAPFAAPFARGRATVEIVPAVRQGAVEWQEVVEFDLKDRAGNTARVALPEPIRVVHAAALLEEYRGSFPLQQDSWSSLELAAANTALGSWRSQVEGDDRLTDAERSQLLVSEERGARIQSLVAAVQASRSPTIQIEATGSTQPFMVGGRPTLFTNQLEFAVTGIVQHAQTTELSLKGSESSADGRPMDIDPETGRFEILLGIEEGASLDLELTTEGIDSPQRVRVVSDRKAPMIDGSALELTPISTRTLPLSITIAEEGSGVSAVTVEFLDPKGAQPVVLAPGEGSSWSGKLDLPEEGENAMLLRAIDRAGNSAEARFVAVKDTRPPEFESDATEPSSPEVAAGSRVAVRFRATEPIRHASAVWRVEGKDGAVLDSGSMADAIIDGPTDAPAVTLAIDLPDVDAEALVVEVEVEDPAGNTARTTSTWSIDYSPWGAIPEEIQAMTELVLGESLAAVVGDELAEDDYVVDGDRRFPRCLLHSDTGIHLLYVASGRFELGAPGAAREVTMGGFYIARTEASTAQVAAARAPSGFKQPSADEGDLPANLRWQDAEVWCSRNRLWLPTEAQWEYAAKGPENLTYPWGPTFRDEFVTVMTGAGLSGSRRSAVAVTEHPGGASWCGALQLAGNMSEWALDVLDPATVPADAVNPEGQNGGLVNRRVVRGGNYRSTQQAEVATHARVELPMTGRGRAGVRPVLRLP